MTLLDIRNQLFSHFCESDTFSTDQFSKIKLDKTLEEERDSLIRVALSEMMEHGLCKPAGSKLWILSNPVGSAGQTIQVSMQASEAVAETIETFLSAHEVDHEQIDKFNLHEGHIWQLIAIINDLIEGPESKKDSKD
jgi:hypothetical protein